MFISQRMDAMAAVNWWLVNEQRQTTVSPPSPRQDWDWSQSNLTGRGSS